MQQSITVAALRRFLAAFPPSADNAVVHLCEKGRPYVAFQEAKYEPPESGGPGVLILTLADNAPRKDEDE